MSAPSPAPLPPMGPDELDALCLGAQAGDPRSARLLARAAAMPWPAGRWTPLMAAAHSGSHAALDLTLPSGDPSAALSDGTTALIVAARRGSAEAVRRLIPVSDPLAKGSKGRTALMFAIRSCPPEGSAGHAESAKLLIAACDPLAEDGEGMTALTHAALNPAAAGILRELLARVDASAARSARFLSRTALMSAAQAGSEEAVAILLPASDAGARDSEGLRAADIARSMGHGRIASLIEGYGAALAERSELAAAAGAPNAGPAKARSAL